MTEKLSIVMLKMQTEDPNLTKIEPLPNDDRDFIIVLLIIISLQLIQLITDPSCKQLMFERKLLLIEIIPLGMELIVFSEKRPPLP